MILASMPGSRGLAPLVGALLVAACQGPAPRVTLTRLNDDYESAQLGALPLGFHADETNGKGTPARWEVADTGADGSKRCLRLTETANAGDTYNLLLTEEVAAADLRLEISLRADGGAEDQGGGLVWRAQGPDAYYMARWNPLEDNVRIYKVDGGARTQLGTAEVIVDTAHWHRLAVLMRGEYATVFFNGAKVLEARDATFAGAGRVGLWSKADAATSFDDLRLQTLGPRE